MYARNQHGSMGDRSNRSAPNTKEKKRSFIGNRSYLDALKGTKTHIYAFDKYDRRFVLDDDSGRFVFDTHSVKSDAPTLEGHSLLIHGGEEGSFVFTSKQRKKNARRERQLPSYLKVV